MSEPLSIKARITSRSLPFSTLAAVASSPEMLCHATEVSRFANGIKLPQFKYDRLLQTLESIEEMLDGVAVTPDLRNPVMVRRALNRLPQIKAEQARLAAAEKAEAPAVVHGIEVPAAVVHSTLAVDNAPDTKLNPRAEERRQKKEAAKIASEVLSEQ